MVRRTLVIAALLVMTVGGATVAWAVTRDGDDGKSEAGLDTAFSRDEGASPAGTGPTATHAHDSGDCRPTEAQQSAADTLIGETRAATTGFADLAAATGAGFRPVTPPELTMVHYVNLSYVGDGRELDPARPESLVYLNSDGGTVFAGVMYLANQGNTDPAQVGGCLTQWHTHTDLCFSLATQQIVDFTGSDGACDTGQLNYVPPPMMHVWMVDHPDGPFAHDVDGDALVEALGD